MSVTKTRLWLALILIVIGTAMTTTQLNAQSCATELPAETKQLDDLLNLLPPAPPGCDPPYTVTIKAHIVRHTNGTGGLSTNTLNTAISELANYFTDTGTTYFVFELNPQIDYIDSDFYYSQMTTQSDWLQLRIINRVPNEIDVYFVDVLKDQSGSYCGAAWYPTDFFQAIIMDNGCTGAGQTTLAHEIGHYFNLYHTFETAAGVEYANGSNCASAGDLLCDTPAEYGNPPSYNPQNNWNSSCNYTGPALDSNGDPYNSDVTLLMNYADDWCQTRFTPQSFDRMVNALWTWNSDHIVSPCVQITQPAESPYWPDWYIGTNQTIAWSSIGDISNVDEWRIRVFYIYDDYLYWEAFNDVVPVTTTSYEYYVTPNEYGTGYCGGLPCQNPGVKVVLEALDGQTVVASSEAYAWFRSLSLIYEPSGSLIDPPSFWYSESDPLLIKWFYGTGYTATGQAIYITCDDGVTWNRIDGGSLADSDREFTWYSPTFPYGWVKFKIESTMSGPGLPPTLITGYSGPIVLGEDGPDMPRTGIIQFNTVWSGTQTLNGDVSVYPGAKLTVQEGTSILIDDTDTNNLASNSAKIEIINSGTIELNGTGANPVTIQSSSATPTDSDWYAMIDVGSLTMHHTSFKHCEIGLVHASNGGTVDVQNCTFSNNGDFDFRFYGTPASAQMLNSTITVGGGGGLEINAADVTVMGNTITGNANSDYGIKSTAANAVIDGNTVSGFSGARGVWVTDGSATIENNIISNCASGMELNAGTHVIGSSGNGNNISSCTRGIWARCSGGSCPAGCTLDLRIRRNTLYGNGIGVVVDGTDNVDLGMSGDLGYNSITYSSQYCLQNLSGCGTVSARGNYFGDCMMGLPPYCANGSFVIAQWLCSSPSYPGSDGGGHGGKDDEPVVAASGIIGNSPNPFNPSTTVRFGLHEPGAARIAIYDVAGRRIIAENLGSLSAGEHSWTWQGRDQGGSTVASGVYFVVLEAGTIVDKRKIVLLK